MAARNFLRNSHWLVIQPALRLPKITEQEPARGGVIPDPLDSPNMIEYVTQARIGVEGER